VPEWQAIPANQATLTFQNIPAFWGNMLRNIHICSQRVRQGKAYGGKVDGLVAKELSGLASRILHAKTVFF